MPKVDIHQEILNWSTTLPAWQRDALRRLVTLGVINDSDVADLASLCKSQYGLEAPADGRPLDKHHLPTRAVTGKPVTLLSITHHGGVNALAPNQTVRFFENLTVVYGNNGSGKSGYTRILKRACRARGAEPILGNVTSIATPTKPSATIRFRHGKTEKDYVWDDSSHRESRLSRVSVFDSQCANVYISERMDVAFRPMGLDLFDRLASVCEEVKKLLEKEIGLLQDGGYNLPRLPEATVASKLLSRLTALTSSEEVRALGTLSEVEEQRIGDLKQRIDGLTADRPHERAQALRLRANRVENLIGQLEQLGGELGEDKVTALVQRAQELDAERAVRQSLMRTLESMPLTNIGSERWHQLWQAARAFSDFDSYTEETFPFVGSGSRCVLCQQPLLEEGAARLQELAAHVAATAHGDFQRKLEEHNADMARLRAVSIEESVGNTIDEVKLHRPEVAEVIRVYVEEMERYRDAVVMAVERRSGLSQHAPPLERHVLCDYRDLLRDRADEIISSNSGDQLNALRSELAELEARKILGENVDVVLREILRLRKIAAYEQCIKETRTNAITRKSTDVTKRTVTGQLVDAFSEELRHLDFGDVEVELAQAGGSRGALHHKLRLIRAPREDVSKIVSEGEARCLSIASFFAELSTADDPSAILFDDPVSSLDQRWRHRVAERLAKEATRRQVVVFTHDLVFWRALLDEAEKLGTGRDTQYLRRTALGPGALSDSVPSPATNVSTRRGDLKQRWVAADKLWRKGRQDEYEAAGNLIYGMLREAWERGVEEVLLNSVVERYRVGIETKNKILKLADINESDCRAVQSGMAKCSTYMSGHDTSAADNPPFPKPEEVERDIQAFLSWVDEIRKRRK